MNINDLVLKSSEKIIFALRELYLSFGYNPYSMSKFEEYDLYAKNKDFLVSDNVITFTDTGGKLMALKPDVTLSIIKNSIDSPETVSKVFYNENVYRVSKGTGSFKEIMQTGIECFGNVGNREICEVLEIAAQSLKILSNQSVLTVSDIDILASLVSRLALTSYKTELLYKAIGEKNIPEIEKICSGCDSDTVCTLTKLLSLSGKATTVLPGLEELLFSANINSNFISVMKHLSNSQVGKMFTIDFSVISDINYYNGIVFKGFLRDVPVDVLSGGQYDRLMKKMGRKSSAIGFAVDTDALDRFDFENSSVSNDDYINIALPKGRLGEKIYDLFARSGFECDGILEPNRKLIFENSQKKLRFFWVKPSDVAIYVERGAADIGVAGKDILLEYSPDVYELLDLKKGKCRMAVAAPKSFKDDTSKTLRVATKFSNVAKAHYLSKGRNIDIIHLNGSIEIAPILGLSDVIVDIVETGATLRENNLDVFEEIFPISARLIANKSSYKFKSENIEKIKNGLSLWAEEEK